MRNKRGRERSQSAGHVALAPSPPGASAVDRDRQRFTSLVQHADPTMRGIAWRILGNQAAMEDALQEAYIKAWRHFERFDGDRDGFRAWLARIVHNTCIDHIRRERKRQNDVDIDDRRDVDSGAVAIADRVLSRQAIRDALRRLPADQAAAMALVDGEGYSYDEVAQILEVPRGTVASRVARARETMRRELGFEKKEVRS